MDVLTTALFNFTLASSPLTITCIVCWYDFSLFFFYFYFSFVSFRYCCCCCTMFTCVRSSEDLVFHVMYCCCCCWCYVYVFGLCVCVWVFHSFSNVFLSCTFFLALFSIYCLLLLLFQFGSYDMPANIQMHKYHHASATSSVRYIQVCVCVYYRGWVHLYQKPFIQFYNIYAYAHIYITKTLKAGEKM